MRISDWSSDVCSSDLAAGKAHAGAAEIGLPTVERAERRAQRVANRAGRLAIAAEPVEIDLVEHDRAGAVQLFALEAALDDRRQARAGDRRGTTGSDHAQHASRPAPKSAAGGKGG